MAGIRGKALPDDMMPELLVRRAAGMNCEELAVWLLDVHKIQISAVAIRKRLAKVREARAEVTQSVIADKLSRTVGKDLDEVGFAIERSLEDEHGARLSVEDMRKVVGPDGKDTLVRAHEPGSESWSRIMHVISKSRGDLKGLLELRLKLVGADTGKKAADPKQVTDDLLAKVDKLLFAANKKSPPVEPTPTLQ